MDGISRYIDPKQLAGKYTASEIALALHSYNEAYQGKDDFIPLGRYDVQDALGTTIAHLRRKGFLRM